MLRMRARGFAALLLGSASFAGTVWATAGPAGTQARPEPTAPYIVVLEEPADEISTSSVNDHAEGLDVTPTHVYSHALAGYSAELTPSQVDELEADDRVAYVEEDAGLQLQQAEPQEIPTGVRRIFGPDNPNIGLGDQVDERVDVDVAIIDSGVAYHPDLNVVDRVDCTRGGGTCVPGGDDRHGHGTHVAGTVAAIDDGEGVVGVAPGARVWSHQVCVPSGFCATSAVIAGVDHATANADTIEVVNMSLGGATDSQALGDAITASVDTGIVYAVAAGNAGNDASTSQPGNHPDVITVSALVDSDGQPGGAGAPPACRDDEQDDQLGTFSNWGALVEVAAPGVCITSTWNDGGYSTISGTSMASPHVAGAAALLTSGDQAPTDRAGALAVRDTIQTSGNLDWTWESRGEGDYQEPLLDVGDASVYQPDVYVPAAAAFDVSCDDATLTCEVDGSASSHPDQPISSWSWDFGDGTQATGPTASHTYDRAATFTITLTVTAGDATGTAIEEVQVGTPKWQPAAAVPGAQYRYASAQCPDDPDGIYKLGNRTWRYDHSDDSWTDLGEGPGFAEGRVAVCTDAGTIHVLGSGSGSQEHHVYDIETNTWVEAAPVPRATKLASVGHWDGQIYLLGGTDGGNIRTTTDQADVYDIATDSWSVAPSLPQATGRAGHVQVGSHVYLIGGWGPEGPTARTLRFDMATQTWETGPSMATARHELSVVATDTALYAFGGFLKDGADQGAEHAIATDAVERLETDSWSTGPWTQLPDPYPRRVGFIGDGGACSPDGDDAVISGFAGGTAVGWSATTTDEQWQMTVEGESCAHTTWSSASDVSGGQAWFAEAQCADDPNSYYKFGGTTSGLGSATDTVWRYDAPAAAWSELAPYPAGARSGMSAVCLPDGTIHVMGGISGGSRDHFVYDTATNTWSEAAQLPRDVSFPSLGAWNGRIYMAGGNESGILDPTATVSVYDVATNSWVSDAAPLPEPMAMSGYTQVGSHLYMVGGFGTGSPNTNVTRTLRFDMATGTWSNGPAFPSARFGMGLVATSDALYAVGGLDDGHSSYTPTDVVERLALDSWPTGQWETMDPLPMSSGFLGGSCAPGGSSVTIGAVGGVSDGLDSHGQHWQLPVSGETCS